MAKNENNTEKQSDGKQDTNVEVSLPSCIKIELVQGNELRHYEIFFSLASLSLSTAVGFWIAHINTPHSAFFWTATAFSGLALASGITALYFRSKLYSEKIIKVAPLNIFKDKKIKILLKNC